MPNLLVTIDTEPDCDSHWNRSTPLSFSSITEGIPQFLRPLWTRYSIKPIYFTSPEVVKDPNACKALRNEVERGAIIGAHLHSEYIAPQITISDPAGKPSLEYPCFAHSFEIEEAKIKRLTEEIENNLGVRPIWYRAGRYGADLDTMHILRKLGYKYDSSVTPEINWQSQGGPDHSKAPNHPYWIAPSSYYEEASPEASIGIQEFPITISGKRFGVFGRFTPNNWMFYNWLRPTVMTVWEQKWMIQKLLDENPNQIFVLMFHSMEIMPGKSPYVQNTIMQKRFLNNLEAIIDYLK